MPASPHFCKSFKWTQKWGFPGVSQYLFQPELLGFASVCAGFPLTYNSAPEDTKVNINL